MVFVMNSELFISGYQTSYRRR